MKLEKKKIEIEMARRCITSKELQKKSGIPCGTYIKVVGGYNVKPETAGKLARALGCDVTKIMEDKAE